MDHPEGAGSQRADRVDFDPRVRLEFRGAQISSDGGLLVMRELDDALGLSDLASASLRDNRIGKNTVHQLDGLFRQSVFGRLAGYEDVNDADHLALDPVMRQVVGGRAVDAQAASASQMGRFETETLALAENRAALADLNGQWIDRFHDRNGLKYIVLDMDSSVSPTHGDQEGSAWNGHFDCTCYHPNFLFNQFGMLERCALRNGNVHSADGWKDVLDPVIARYAKRDILRFFRADAAYAIPALYARLEETGYFYAIRLPANNVLRKKIAHRLTRPVGRPSLTKVKRIFVDFDYQAASWDKPLKNEAPYILEWIAYHRAIGVDNFLIYTNGCEDGTAEILDRLDAMGLVNHRNNDAWKGNSPQQYALNQALKEPVIRNADWIIHIDVDEFMNIRCGNGTLDDFFAAAPDATNVAMTWRLFGYNGVTDLSDDFVIDQFDHCAPKFCPKPHTVWGFKTMFKNIGAYAKMSCHRPNQLVNGFKDRVKWVNGSGRDMTREAAENGWRNSVKSIGYDLLQLNHYALRSAESFLIKRQRGRALHVDRSIGINYWIRMDWSDHRDITIKRNIPRLQAEYDRLLADPELRKWHRAGLDWHRAKAAELHATPEFQDLYHQALKVKLTTTERVAYALALDMES